MYIASIGAATAALAAAVAACACAAVCVTCGDGGMDGARARVCVERLGAGAAGEEWPMAVCRDLDV